MLNLHTFVHGTMTVAFPSQLEKQIIRIFSCVLFVFASADDINGYQVSLIEIVLASVSNLVQIPSLAGFV